MRRHLFALFAVILTALSSALPALGLCADAGAGQHRPRIGLVLSGGGARGAAHIGVLKVLEEMRIPVDVVVGTSMGSLVGGTYAAGVTPQELERRVTAVDWNVLFNDDPPRRDWPAQRKQASMTPTFDFTIGVHNGKFKLPPGAIAGQKVQLFFSDLTKGVERIHDFDDFPIPFRAVATDLEDGQMKVFDRGPLPVAMRSSMSVPTIFAPMEWENHLYVDGGLVRNLPIDVARAMGVDIIIAVNLGSGYLPRDQLGNIVGVTGQMIAILTQQNVDVSLRQIRPQDVLILPDLGDIGSGDFNRAAEAIVTGVKAARKAAPELARFSVGEAEYAAWKAARFGPGHPVRAVGEVRIAGLEVVNQGVFDHLIADQADRPLERRQLVTNIQQVYGSGDFERISYRFEPGHDGADLLIVNALEKAWGPGYLSLGLGLKYDSRGTGLFGLRGTYDQTWINHLGGTWSTDVTLGNTPGIHTEFFQPLSLERTFFVAPYLDLNSTPESVFLKDQRVARYDVARGRIGADLGTTIGGAQARVGLYYGQTRVSLDTGIPQMPTGRVTDTGLHASLVYDTLDSAAVPRSGNRLTLDLKNPLKGLGADVQYSRTELTAETAVSAGANTFGLRLRGGSSFGAEMPYYDQFMLGGFLNLSGYAYDQFRGNDMAFAALIYYRQIAALTPPLGRGLYLGASLEAGWLSDGTFKGLFGTPYQVSAEATRYGGSLFFGSDTWFGPFFLAAGLSSSGEATYYVILGRP